MSKVFKLSVACGLAVFLAAPVAQAGGEIAKASEVTQLMNNAELVMQVKAQIESNAKQVLQYTTQLKQLKQQMEDGVSMATDLLTPGLDGIKQELKVALNTKNAFDKLYGSVDQLQKQWQKRMLEATLKGISTTEYVANEAKRIQQGNQQAIDRMEQEKDVLLQVEEDYSLAKTWGSQISNQRGINSSIGLLNTQMNRLLQQNARMVSIMAQANGRDKAFKEQRAAQDAVQAKSMMQKQQDSNASAWGGTTSSLKSMDTGKAVPSTKFDNLN